jgi:hypothetical protein
MIDVVADTTRAAVIVFLDVDLWYPVIAWAVDVDEHGDHAARAWPIILGPLPPGYCVVLDRTLEYLFPEEQRRFDSLDEARAYGQSRRQGT